MVLKSCVVQGRVLYFDRGGGGIIADVLFYYYNGHVLIIWLNMRLCVSSNV
jgi:hypothetical protein